MYISPNFIRIGAIRCLIYSAVLLFIGGYWAYDTWLGWSKGVLTHQSRSGLRIITASDMGWHFALAVDVFVSSLLLIMGLRYLLIFIMPQEIRERELTKLAEFYQERISVPTRMVILVAIVFLFIAITPIWL